MKINVWNLNGYVYLNKNFINKYRKLSKDYGITKLSKELDTCYDVIAFYRRQKLVKISFLERVCDKLNISKEYAEKSVISYSGNLKTKYVNGFPVIITPTVLRIVSMLIGDGCGSVDAVCRWSQHKRNVIWGIRFIDSVLNITPHVGNASGSDCQVVTIPNFLVSGVADILQIKNIKIFDFFESVCKLDRIYRFQVFAQLVVDEGSPDNNFVIAQKPGELSNGIAFLLDSLGYKYIICGGHIHLHTESFPLINKDYLEAKQKFGEYGGFWFKDDRFEQAVKITNPAISKNRRLYNETFDSILCVLKQKKIFTRENLLEFSKFPEEALERQIVKRVASGQIIRLRYGYYSFPEFLDSPDVIQLRFSKEDQVMAIINKNMEIGYGDIINFSGLGNTQARRAVNNLIKDGKIFKNKHGYYKIN